MTPEAYRSKLIRWLAGHPVQRPPASHREGYTREVMARVERVSRAAPDTARPPRVWAAAAAALACAAIAFVLMNRSPGRLASAIARDADVLSAVGEGAWMLPTDAKEVEEVEEEWQLTDRLMLAEAPPAEDDEAWVQETLQLLDDLESEPPDQAVDENSVDEHESLEEELRRLDEADLENA